MRRLARALKDAQLHNIVSVAADDETLFKDEHDEDFDLEPVLASLSAWSKNPSNALTRLELVAQTEDDVGTYFVQVLADRVHPVDDPPILVRVYAVLRDFDVRELHASGYRNARESVSSRLQTHMLERLRSGRGYLDFIAPLRERLGRLCIGLEQAFRRHLCTCGTAPILLNCVLRPHDAVAFDQVRPHANPGATPLFRDHPGLPEATYYLRLWLPMLQQLHASISHTLVVDELGRPVLHVGETPLALEATVALLPGQSIAAPTGLLDVAYFDGNTYAQELRDNQRLPPSGAPQGDQAWTIVRNRELGVRHKKLGQARESLWSREGILTWPIRFNDDALEH